MKNKKNNKIKHWIKNPIKLDNEEISENIEIDGSGFIVRDYRFQPKILPDSLDNYNPSNGVYILPSNIQLFYAWMRHNRHRAIRDVEKYESKRKKSDKRGDDERFQKKYIKCKAHQLYLYDDITRTDCINIIKKLLKSKKDYTINLTKLSIILTKLNLDINYYKEPIYKEFLVILHDIIQYVYTPDDIRGINIDLDECSHESNMNIKLDKLIIMNKIMTIANI